MKKLKLMVNMNAGRKSKMSKPYDEKLFCCDRCAEYFPAKEMIKEDDLQYCQECFKLLVERGEI